MSKPAQYRCPICQQTLTLTQRTFRCENNHCFDKAKEGYVNLLPVQFKHSKDPGDNKAMVNARRAFLEQGYYQPLIEKLVETYQQYGNASGTLFDAGCGEGYYTHQHQTDNNQVYGIDIAKEAIKKAAKKYSQCHFSVGTLSQLPFHDQHFDWLFSIYAPILEQEFTRVLKPSGYLLTVTPAKRHLFELKEKIYQNANEHDITRQPIEHLRLVTEQQLSYQMNLATGDDILNLLSMTPFAFKASEQVKHTLAQMTDFSCQADFLIRLYQK
ncbi:23S rRNA (guanine(745)-N(1))-methyltransferase [Thalassotalea insulae]|uniref:23S rRNA (Guanine(745)-N(1))-methyltransferase n=1 Tax=Thalassotalea insulae TaxID=2056778 RepID=A0ABQ6GQ98_9GAMM|nr:23S rRNA (guanine(745)-N(1))-methyltransferase [Thalassotalea insulae]GLX76880.1 23S rRNA (guanine(745)-N(1))-methyltransferase [Thalassotalea insulae]